MSLDYDLPGKSILVGLDDGWIVYYDADGKEVLRQRNFNNESVISLKLTENEDQKKLIALERKALTIYKCH